MIEHIFENLSHNDQLNVSLVCHRFNEIFGENLKNFKLVLDLKNICFGDVPRLSRQYRQIKVKMLIIIDDQIHSESFPEENVLNMFNAIGSEVRKLKLVQCILNDHFLVQVLKTMPMLQTLIFQKTEIDRFESIDYNSIELPAFLNLKEICIGARSWDDILRVLGRAEKIEKFSFLYQTRENKLNDSAIDIDDETEVLEYNYTDSQYEIVKTFLSRQRNLKNLEIRDGNFFNTPFVDFTFQLECIELFISHLIPSQADVMSKFVRHHRHLKEVLLNCMLYSHVTSYFECLDHFMHLESIKKLQIVFYNDSGIHNYFRDCQIVNSNIEDLYFALEPLNDVLKFNENIVCIFPNIMRLQMVFFGNWLLSSKYNTSVLIPLNQLNRLKSIVLMPIESRFLRPLKIPSLTDIENFEITRSDSVDWKIFIINHPGIEKIIVRMSMKRSDKAGLIFVENVMKKLQKIRSITCCIMNKRLSKQAIMMLTKLAKTRRTLKKLSMCSNKIYI